MQYRTCPVCIPDTSGMTHTAPTVTKLQRSCEVSELPMNAGTPDRRNSRLTSELPTLSIFEKHVTELKLVRCRNSRHMSELPTVGTPDLRRNSRPSRLLKTSRWLLVIHTGHVRYDQDSETSKSVEVRDVGTPDPCRDSRPSELPTYVGTPNKPTRE